jgi:hypothetical protein
MNTNDGKMLTYVPLLQNLFSGMVGRMLAPGTVLVFREAVSRLQSPDLVSRGLAAELLADQEQPHAIQQLLARLHQIQDLARYGTVPTRIYRYIQQFCGKCSGSTCFWASRIRIH